MGVFRRTDVGTHIMMHNIKLIFSILITLLLITGCKGYYMFKHTHDWWANKEETTATVISVFHQPETVFRYEFFVDGKSYKGGYAFYENNEGVVVGTKYKVAYNPINPEQNHIQLHTQFFEESEKVSYTFTEVKGISLIQVERDGFEIIRLSFTIVVDGKKYRAIRNEFINKEGYKYEDIVDKKFKVKYWVENPWRSIIMLDEPSDEDFEEAIVKEEKEREDTANLLIGDTTKLRFIGVSKGYDFRGFNLAWLIDYEHRKTVHGAYVGWLTEIKKINGIALILLPLEVSEINGLFISPFGGFVDSISGVSIALGIAAKNINGLYIAAWGGETEMVNGLIVNGVFSTGDKINGVALTSLVNWYDEVNGIQFGLFNRAKTGKLVQIGVINHIKDNPKLLRTLPLLNLRFTK